MAGDGEKFRGAKSCGKDASWESQKNDFPTRLEIPPTPAGFPLSHSFGCCCLLDEELSKKRGHFYFGKDGDTSILV
jgi:hypothetical protein